MEITQKNSQMEVANADTKVLFQWKNASTIKVLNSVSRKTAFTINQ